MSSPTLRQVEVLRAIARLSAGGVPPTRRELGRALGIRSTNGVTDHLVALARRGLVDWAPMRARALVITPAGQQWAARREA